MSRYCIFKFYFIDGIEAGFNYWLCVIYKFVLLDGNTQAAAVPNIINSHRNDKS